MNKEEQFMLCVLNDECEDLVLHKVYHTLPDKRAEKEGYLRVIDESGEAYLYPASYFHPVRLTRKTRESLLACHA